MADNAHRLTDKKLEEMESGCMPFTPERIDMPYRKPTYIEQMWYLLWHRIRGIK